MSEYTGWSNVGGESYTASVDVVPTLPPGFYETVTSMQGQLYFVRDEVSDRDIIRFPDAPIDEVVTEVEKFWSKADAFAAHGLPHKRGVLLYGPPGSGKTCTLQLIAKSIIDAGGLVFEYSSAFARAYRTLRAVEPNRPLVVTMEDLDALVTPNTESSILNTLDGLGSMHRVVFVGTTNYPEKLDPRLTNRPSRFDRKVLVDHPGEASRRVYLEALVREGDDLDIETWVRDTVGLSLAHLKELFVAVVLLDHDYDEALKRLKNMATRATSFDGEPVVNRGYA